MKFALFYEIPVARPWAPDSEHLAYKNTLEQAIAGEQAGFHAFWTVEHHFLEEYSHCSNPEVLYGAIASRTIEDAARLRRAAHAEAVQPSGAHRGVGRGARPVERRPRRHGHRSLGDAHRARRLRRRPEGHARDVARGDRARRRLLDERALLDRQQVLDAGRPARAAQAVAATAPADLGRDDERRRPRAGRRARPRPVLVRGRRVARGREEEDRHLPRARSRSARRRSASS